MLQLRRLRITHTWCSHLERGHALPYPLMYREDIALTQLAAAATWWHPAVASWKLGPGAPICVVDRQLFPWQDVPAARLEPDCAGLVILVCTQNQNKISKVLLAHLPQYHCSAAAGVTTRHAGMATLAPDTGYTHLHACEGFL
jgi:hypothetical protein